MDSPSRTKSTRKPRLENTGWLRFMVFWSVLIALNPRNFFAHGSGRLLVVSSIVAFFCCCAALRRLELVKPCLPAALLIAVGLFGTPGVLYNKAMGQETGIFVAISMITIVAHAQFLPRGVMRIDPALWLKGLQWFGLGLLSFTVIGFVQKYVGGTVLFHTPWHEAGFLLPIGLLAAYFRSRMVALVLGLLMLLVVIAIDARTTTALCIVNTLGLLALSTLSWTLFKQVSIALVVLGAISYSATYSMIKSFNVSFKESMGGVDNSAFRESLLEFGFSRFRESPVFGDFFSGPAGFHEVIKGLLDEEGVPVLSYPLHNDWLQLAVSGGIVGCSLFFAAFGTCVYTGFQTYYGFRRRSMWTHARLTLLLTICLFNSMLSITVNPVINVVHTGFFLYTLFAMVIILKREYDNINVIFY